MTSAEAYKWAYGKTAQQQTRKIVLYRAAADRATPQDIHRIHLRNG